MSKVFKSTYKSTEAKKPVKPRKTVERKFKLHDNPDKISKKDDLYLLREIYADMVYNMIPRKLNLNLLVSCISRIDELLELPVKGVKNE